MLKEVVASKAAKLIAACVCPVAGTTALTVSVPEVRQAVHRATAPRAQAAPKVRERPAQAVAAAQAVCPTDTPVLLAGGAYVPPATALAFAPVAIPGQNVFPVPPRVFIPGPGGPIGSFNPPPGPGPGPGPGPNPETPPPPPTAVIPEPATWLQMLIGFGVIGGATRVSYRQQRREEARLKA